MREVPRSLVLMKILNLKSFDVSSLHTFSSLKKTIVSAFFQKTSHKRYDFTLLIFYAVI